MKEQDNTGSRKVDPPTWTERSRTARWSIAVILAVLSVSLLVASRFAPEPTLHVCDNQVTFEGTEVKNVCEPYAVEDLAPVLVLIGLLLLPDMSEVTLPADLRSSAESNSRSSRPNSSKRKSIGLSSG